MRQDSITRRTLLAQFAATGIAFCQGISGAPDPLSGIRAEHPRLILTDSELARVLALIREHPLARKCYLDLDHEADKLLTSPTVDFKAAAPRVQSPSRRVLDRVYLLALLYRLYKEPKHLDRALKELQAAASLRDWNPGHFLDVAELTQAFAIGYDWLYGAMTEDQRLMMRIAILQNGLLPGLAAYQSQAPWATSGHAWNLECNAGLAMGALAVAEDARETSVRVMKAALDSLPRALLNYAPDGGWPEGLTSWHAATAGLAAMLASLESALDTDFALTRGHGVESTGRYRVYASSPIAGDPGDALAPEMFWLARRFSEPVFAWHEQKALEHAGRAEPLDLVWFYKEARSPVVEGWPLETIFAGMQTAFLRSSWDDPNGLFLVVKGGENKPNHARQDLGAFIFDAGGVRWAIDAAADLRVAGTPHNTIVIDDQPQDRGASAHISRHEFGPDLSWVELDLSKVYGARAKTLRRRIGIAQRQALVIQDTLAADAPVDALWSMLTDAEIAVHGQTAELTKGGWTLSAEILSPRHAVFDVAPVAGYKKLMAQVGPKIAELELNITLVPYKTGQNKPKVTTRFT